MVRDTGCFGGLTDISGRAVSDNSYQNIIRINSLIPEADGTYFVEIIDPFGFVNTVKIVKQ
jgi:hypothetical protein